MSPSTPKRILARLAACDVPVRLEEPREPPPGKTVTVVIPCYNYGRYLPACVGSVLDQPDVEVEVIVIDDASTDDSQDVAEGLADLDDRVTVRSHPKNLGHIHTYNEGLEQAGGEYLVLLSADDRLAPGALGRASALLDAHPDVGFAYGRATRFTTEDPAVQRQGRPLWMIWRGSDWASRRWDHGRNCILSPEVVMRTSVQRTVGGYRSDFPHTGDADMWIRAASVADVGFLYGVDQAYYRVHGDNMHRTGADQEPRLRLADMRRRLDMFERLASGAPAAQPALLAARRALALEGLREALRDTRSGGADNDVITDLVSFATEACPDVSATDWHRAVLAWQRYGPRWPRRSPLLGASVCLAAARHRSRRLRLETVGAW